MLSKFLGQSSSASPFPRIDRKSASVALLVSALPFSALAYDVNDKLSLGATLTGVYQYGDFDDAGIGDKGRGTVVTDLEGNFHPTERDEFSVVVSFAAANGLNSVSPLSLAPYADDLEDDLENVNGRDRDYLLTAWYKHTFTLPPTASLGLTGGLIDSTGYLDDNAYANDEVGQFMNDIFVNNTLANLPSYDIGAAAELDFAEHWSLRGVWMAPGNGPGPSFNYFGAQLGYRLESAMGEGNYRLMAYTTDDEFADLTGTTLERLYGVGVSIDQQLGETFGVFARFAWQDDEAAVTHDALYSGGLNVSGRLWGRADDEAGLGYAHLEGANSGISDTDALEGYVKFQLSQFADVSLDIQFIQDDAGATQPEAVIYGARFSAYF